MSEYPKGVEKRHDIKGDDGSIIGEVVFDTNDQTLWCNPSEQGYGSFRVNDDAQAEALCKLLIKQHGEMEALGLPD